MKVLKVTISWARIKMIDMDVKLMNEVGWWITRQKVLKVAKGGDKVKDIMSWWLYIEIPLQTN